MAKTNEDSCAGRQRMDAGELAPRVAEFTHRLRQLGYAPPFGPAMLVSHDPVQTFK